MKKKRISLSTAHIIMFSFLAVILIGSLLLSLPISTADGKGVSYIDALFTATTSTCVTGLVTLPTVTAWSAFGQVIILVLIQIGGLGVITITSGIMIALHKRMGLGDRLLIQDAFNLNTLSGLVRFVKKVICGTFIVEAVGALLYMTVFIPEFGIKGIWISIFNSISAFCNAGIDLISENSLCDYAQNPMINAVTMMLIIIGGIGFIVWWDLIEAFKRVKKRGFKAFLEISLHSKIAITATIVLILGGAAAYFILEYNNPLTMKDLGFFERLQLSLFQSVTTRTAGFATIPQQNLTETSAFASLLLMFIGGSPVGTAGGIKTVTFFILIASAISSIKNRNEIILFNRNIPKAAVIKAIAVAVMSFTTAFISTVLLGAVTKAPLTDIMYEAFSATATVGLTRNLTPSLDLIGKLIITVTMYLGRIGPISLAIAFNLRKQSQNKIKNPTENISVG